ncbi:sensor histidine kinase [Gordonia sp. (in: high G+C Gram-positive bacteria)]|uniref:sensor histidine kinase n=1 Tax=Gordonia sp. (in: high G+C Gram-positive bacteria) TaxID=84139 RepID=UPI003C72E8D8
MTINEVPHSVSPDSSPVRTRSPWEAVAQSPVRFLLSADPWRSLAYTFISLVLGWLLFFTYAFIILLPFAAFWSQPLARLERQRVRLLRLAPIDDPHRPLGGAPSSGLRLRDPATRREVGYSLILALLAVPATIAVTVAAVLLVVCALAPLLTGLGARLTIGSWRVDSAATAWPMVPVALPLLIVTLYLCAVLAAVVASTAQALLGPRESDLAAQVAALQSSRGVLVDSFEAQRHQIERDLHDGPQQELVGAAMQLGELAQFTADPAVRADAEAAQQRVERALAILRDTVRGVHPRVLEDHGIEAACAELGGPVAVRVIAGTGWVRGRRLPIEVERGLYYTASEAVTNAVKHAGASTVSIALSAVADTVTMTVTDDGRGGADVSAGRGLAGLVERADALGASLTVVSPQGGPTTVRWSGVVAG